MKYSLKNNSKTRVAVAMSGGVDSSVAAALLKEQGFQVVGIFMKNWSEPVNEKNYCPWVEDLKDIRRVARQLGIKYYSFNFEKEYKEKVVEYFFREYAAGRTPNPDVMCNKEIKFDLFRKAAREIGAKLMATGHYALLTKTKDGVKLLKGIDENKDQTYFLWMLGQEELKDTLFPIGEYKKSKVRALAKKFGLPTAEKKDSQGICFIGPIEVRDFLKTRLRVQKGDVMLSDGRKIGEHEGAWFYTLGQRLGLEKIKWPTTDVPVLFVKAKDIKRNVLIAGEESELYAGSLICDNIHWVNKARTMPCKVEVMIRYRQKPVSAKIEAAGRGKINVSFDKPQRAITPGQSVVFYVHDELIGGGIIK